MVERHTTYEEDEAWQAGFEAAESGESENDNPYPSPSNEHLSWNDGYHASIEQQEQK